MRRNYNYAGLYSTSPKLPTLDWILLLLLGLVKKFKYSLPRQRSPRRSAHRFDKPAMSCHSPSTRSGRTASRRAHHERSVKVPVGHYASVLSLKFDEDVGALRIVIRAKLVPAGFKRGAGIQNSCYSLDSGSRSLCGLGRNDG